MRVVPGNRKVMNQSGWTIPGDNKERCLPKRRGTREGAWQAPFPAHAGARDNKERRLPKRRGTREGGLASPLPCA
jgi:hypothetical protein